VSDDRSEAVIVAKDITLKFSTQSQHENINTRYKTNISLGCHQVKCTSCRTLWYFFADDNSPTIERLRWGWFPANIRINFTSPETRGVVLPDPENRTIVFLFVWTKHWNVTDRQTARSYFSGLHCEQCGHCKKWSFGVCWWQHV